MTTRLFCILALAACGSSQTTTTTTTNTTTDPPGVVQDTRTELEKRRDTACDSLGPKLTACAVADARAEMEAGRMTKADFEANTADAVQRKNTEEFEKTCKVELSSRQVRVLEVCQHEESECEPLVACLENINQK